MNYIEDYWSQGWAGPIAAVSASEAQRLAGEVLELDRKLDLMNSDYRCKSNVLFPLVDQISRLPAITEIVSQITGPEFHCWDTLFWIKQPGDRRDVSFHQDATYWNFDQQHRACTVWFAFTDVLPQHGPVQYATGTHRAAQRRHSDIHSETNLLMRGQTVCDLPHSRIDSPTVPRGHFLIHHPHVIHGSGANYADTPRVALGLIYASVDCKPRLQIEPESTILIQGTGSCTHWLWDPRPCGDWSQDRANWQRAYDRQHANYYVMPQAEA